MAILSGALQLAMGVARFGWVMQVVTSPVLSGFTQAAAILILLSQLPSLLGLRGGLGDWLAAPTLASVDGLGALFGLASLALLLLSKKRWPRFPAVVAIMGGAAALSAAVGYEAKGGAVVGALPAGLPHGYWPGALPWGTFGQLVMPVLVITLVSFLETASSAKVDHQKGGTRWNENQDLIAHGMAKISAGLCGSFATSASFSRSAINLYAGARTGWATLFATAVVFLALLWLTPLLHHVPQAVLAAVVVAAIVNLIQPALVVPLWRISRVEAVIGVATFALTLATAPKLYWGVLAGVMMNLTHFLYQRLHPRIIEVGLHPDGSLRDRDLWRLSELAPKVLALRMDAELDFASARALEQRLAALLYLRTAEQVSDVCLFAQPINRIDVTGVETFVRIAALVREHGARLHVIGLKLPVERALERAGILPSPNVHIYRTERQAVEALQEASAPAPETTP
jgi:SulP family sulfate permease